MKPGTYFHVVQKAGLATHLVVDSLYNTKAICGIDPGHYPSYSVAGKVSSVGRLEYLDGIGCQHHIDCHRCLALLEKSLP